MGDSQLVLNFDPRRNVPLLVLKKTTVEEVEKYLMGIPDPKATGDDGIPIRFIKMTRLISAKIICHIINLTIATNTIPLDWKSANITPIFKEGDRGDPANYRPISVLPAISKILERIVHSQLYDHITTYNLLSEAQFGFRKYHSTSTCVLKLLDNVYRNIEQGKLTGVVFLDLKKAFDTVNHSILINKLRSFNVHQNSILWFDNYLKDRKQQVRIKDCRSDSHVVKCGVPQGSILGPLLFIIYINDLEQYLTDCNVNLYADDTALYTSANSHIELLLNLRLELTVVSEWLKANRLTLNIKKTKLVVFGSRQKLSQTPQLKLAINGEQLEQVSQMKYLGVILDHTLTFDAHIDYVFSKSVKKLGILRKSRDYLDMDTSVMLYKSLVLPHFDYCDLVYCCTNAANLQKLQTLQNSACRTLLGAGRRAHVSDMHNELKLLTLEQRRTLHLGTECFKHIHNEASSLHSLFEPNVGRPTRSSGSTYKIPNLKTDTGRRAFSYRGPHHWNGLPNEAKNSENLNAFKTNYLNLILRDVNHPG